MPYENAERMLGDDRYGTGLVRTIRCLLHNSLSTRTLPILRLCRDMLVAKIEELEPSAHSGTGSQTGLPVLELLVRLHGNGLDEGQQHLHVWTLIALSRCSRALRDLVAEQTSSLGQGGFAPGARLRAFDVSDVVHRCGRSILSRTFPHLITLILEGLPPTAVDALFANMAGLPLLESLWLDFGFSELEHHINRFDNETHDFRYGARRNASFVAMTHGLWWLKQEMINERVEGALHELAKACREGAVPRLKSFQWMVDGCTPGSPSPGVCNALLESLPPTAALWCILGEPPVYDGATDVHNPGSMVFAVRQVLCRDPDLNWRNPNLYYAKAPCTPLEYICIGQPAGWAYDAKESTWHMSDTSDVQFWQFAWVRVAYQLLSCGATTDGFARLEQKAGREMPFRASDCERMLRCVGWSMHSWWQPPMIESDIAFPRGVPEVKVPGLRYL